MTLYETINPIPKFGKNSGLDLWKLIIYSVDKWKPKCFSLVILRHQYPNSLDGDSLLAPMPGCLRYSYRRYVLFLRISIFMCLIKSLQYPKAYPFMLSSTDPSYILIVNSRLCVAQSHFCAVYFFSHIKVYCFFDEF